MRDDYNKSVKKTDNEFKNWCQTKGTKIFRIEHVITWEDWDDGIGVYIFAKTNKELNNLSENDIENLKTEYLSGLKKNNYPFDKFPKVAFEFDSDENVRNNYEGVYFLQIKIKPTENYKLWEI